MAIAPETFTVNIDTTAIKAQVSGALSESLKDIAAQFRSAAAALDPQGAAQHEAWLYTRGYNDAEAGSNRAFEKVFG